MIPCTTDKLIVGTYKIILNGYDLGSTTGGVTISQSNEFTEVFNDQTPSLQAVFRNKQDFMIKTTMRDMTLDKLRIIYGLKEGFNGTDVLCINADAGCTFPEEYSMTIEGPGPGCMCRQFHFPRVIITPSSIEYIIDRTKQVEVAVEFRVLPSCPDGLIGCISDSCGFINTDLDTQVAFTVSDDPFPNYTTPAP